ncbi:MAG: hypothetical protein RLZZ21_253 [Planctomycetota bacterium]|jgi:hypothetical protein
MAVIELMRKSKGGRVACAQSDLRVYFTRETSKTRPRFSVGLRVSEQVMKRLRWIVGDHVSAAYDNEAKTWSIRRVADRKGNALSGQGKKGGSGTVRFAVDESQMEAFGIEVGDGYDAELVSDDGDLAVFMAK